MKNVKRKEKTTDEIIINGKPHKLKGKVPVSHALLCGKIYTLVMKDAPLYRLIVEDKVLGERWMSHAVEECKTVTDFLKKTIVDVAFHFEQAAEIKKLHKDDNLYETFGDLLAHRKCWDTQFDSRVHRLLNDLKKRSKELERNAKRRKPQRKTSSTVAA